MKKNLLVALSLTFFIAPAITFSADEQTAAPAGPAETKTAVAVQAPVSEPAGVPPAPAPAAEETTEAAANENLEFVSGEVSAVDAVAKSMTVKLYGEKEENVTDKTLTVTTDASTDITDGEKNRELGSLVAGTEVDIEYDPATKKATYIFVY